jgi:hypothetical protein
MLQIASARLRTGPSAYSVLISASVAGNSRAAPTPCAARDDQQGGIRRQRAEQRRQREQQHAQPVETAAADQVGGAATQQQAAAERHGVGTDHPLQLLRVDLQRAAHVVQGDEDDGGVQGDDQLRGGQQGQRPARVFEGRHRRSGSVGSAVSLMRPNQ